MMGTALRLLKFFIIIIVVLSLADMQAVYMKSVRSPGRRGGADGGRFRPQYQHAPVNVFSQPPQPEDEDSQYQEDSFCVGSEEEGIHQSVSACAC